MASSPSSASETKPKTFARVSRKSASLPAVSTPTGNVNAHHPKVNGRCFALARTVSAIAIASQYIANPHTSTPYASPAIARPCPSAGQTAIAAFPSAMIPAIDWPSGPTTSHIVVTSAPSGTL